MRTEQPRSGGWSSRGESSLSPEVIRRAMEVIEQAPAEALYAKLLRTLLEAGVEADVGGAVDASRKIAFAYKLTVELGAKLGVLSQEHLSRRRRQAAILFGDDDGGSAFDGAHHPSTDTPFGASRDPAAGRDQLFPGRS